MKKDALYLSTAIVIAACVLRNGSRNDGHDILAPAVLFFLFLFLLDLPVLLTQFARNWRDYNHPEDPQSRSTDPEK